MTADDQQPKGKRRRGKIPGQFSWRLVEMLESLAYRVLSLSARRILDRLEIELGHHAGHDNGALPVTFVDFENYGIDRHAIAPAIREAVALGFVEITEQGKAGNADFRAPNKFRLTYKQTDKTNPTDDWRKIQTMDAALALARAARAPIKRPKRKNNFPVGVNTSFSVGNPHRKPKSPVGETPTTAIPEKPPLLSISRGGGQPSTTSLKLSSLKQRAKISREIKLQPKENQRRNDDDRRKLKTRRWPLEDLIGSVLKRPPP
jgi:hypothetical protein